MRSDDSVACWGADYVGQGRPPQGSFVSVSAGDNHTCGVRSDGSTACWGDNYHGQVKGRAKPVGRAGQGSLVSVSAGSTHTCGVRSDGSVACWGTNGYPFTADPFTAGQW